MDHDKLFDLAPKQLDRVLSFFSRVEAKASFVFAINSALLGALAVHVDRADFNDWRRYSSLALTALALAVSYYYVYKCSFPNLSGGHLSLVYFKEIGRLREQTYIQKFREMSEDAYVDDILGQTWRNSEILTEKFRTIKIAFILTGVSLLPWTVYLSISSVSHLSLPLH